MFDELLNEANKLSEFDKKAILALTYKPEWQAYEKLLNNLIFRNYRQILVDDDVKGARKLIYFATSLKNIPKSFKNENNMDTSQNEVEQAGSDAFGIEI